MPVTNNQSELHSEFANISDPTDFRKAGESSKSLQALDASLRCSICKDFYVAPVLLANCGHSFCSFCIRDVFTVESAKRQCPMCKEKIPSESSLKKNSALEEAVTAWKQARGPILVLATEPGPECGEEGPNHSRLKRKRSLSPNLSSSSKRQQTSDAGPELHPCPICGNELSETDMGKHVDSGCEWMGTQLDQEKKQQWASFFPGTNTSPTKTRSKGKGKGPDRQSLSVTPEEKAELPLEPIPVPAYGILKDKDVKELLKKSDLPLDGKRDDWIQRHRQWCTLYNANLDSSKPRALTEIKKEFKAREESLKRSKVQSKRDKKTADDVPKYLRDNSNEFSSLIESVRGRDEKSNSSKNGETHKESKLIITS